MGQPPRGCPRQDRQSACRRIAGRVRLAKELGGMWGRVGRDGSGVRTGLVLIGAALLLRHAACAWAQPRLQVATRNALLGKPGAVVLLDVASGQVLAVVNPDMAARRTFRPGSVFKIVTAWAALETGAADPREQTECRNVFSCGGQRLRCCLPGGHGKLDMAGALAKSCNVYFYHLSRRVSTTAVLQRARSLGFGAPSGRFGAAEKSGRLPRRINAADAPHFAIGDLGGTEVTVAQMAEMVRRLAIARGAAPEFIRRAMLTAVRRGTAAPAAVPGLAIAGKTGSPSREWGGGTHAWFVGFAPAEKPEVALAVLVLKGHGRDDAAPVARRILSAWLISKKERAGPSKERNDA